LGRGACRFETDPPPVFGIVRRDRVQLFFNRADTDSVRPSRGDDAYDAYFRVSGLDTLYAELRGRGAEIVDGPGDGSTGNASWSSEIATAWCWPSANP
jgi:hypothetical protein